MGGDLPGLAAILGMAVVTYGLRAAGLLLLGSVVLPPRLDTALRYVPGTVLVSLVAPGLAAGGWIERVAALTVVVVAARGAPLPLTMVVGVGLVAVARAVLLPH